MRNPNVHESRWQDAAAAQAGYDWTRCLYCGTAEDLVPRKNPPTAYERPLCRSCLEVVAEQAIRDLFPE